MHLPDTTYITYSEPYNCDTMRAHPKWKDRPDYRMSQDNIPDSEDLSEINHPNFAIILLNRLKKFLDEEKQIQQDYKDRVELARSIATEINSVA
jgi:hypothetical protein